MKKVLSGLVFLIVFTLASCGSTPSNSGGPGGGPQPATVQGKWTIHATSTQGQGTALALFDFTGAPGNLSSAAAMICNLTPNVACIGSLIGNGTVTAQGTVQANGAMTANITETPTTSSPCVVAITGTLTGNAMTGSYNGCADGGTFTGSNDPSSTGTYSGQLNSTANPTLIPTSFSANVNEAPDFTLTASATLTNSVCFSSLSFGSPSIAIGEAMFLQDTQHGVYVLAIPGVSPPNLAYVVSPTSFCSSDKGQGSITKH
jgi:hypothetical protein